MSCCGPFLCRGDECGFPAISHCAATPQFCLDFCKCPLGANEPITLIEMCEGWIVRNARYKIILPTVIAMGDPAPALSIGDSNAADGFLAVADMTVQGDTAFNNGSFAGVEQFYLGNDSIVLVSDQDIVSGVVCFAFELAALIINDGPILGKRSTSI